MLPFPRIDPDIIAVGPLHIRWYGMMYVLGFAASYILTPRQHKAIRIGLRGEALDSLFTHLFLGLLIGARIGYILFYHFNNLGDFLASPLEVVAVWKGGMSFHGGLLGCAAAGVLFCRRRGFPLAAVADSVVVSAPIGLGLGRIGNFINGELFGRPSNLPWAMVFPDGGPLPRHPSQLYEAASEGLLLFLILWFLRKRPLKDGMLTAVFLTGYSLIRFLVEFTREPDAHLGTVAGPLTMGQVLSVLMLLAATGLALHLGRKQPSP